MLHHLLTFVLFNLIKNALHAMRVVGKGEITIATSNNNEFHRLIFTDTASGISEKDMPHIFDTFFTAKEGGTGIGLAFCKNVMNTFGGTMGCESVLGEYTRFTLTFPTMGFAQTKPAQLLEAPSFL